MNFVFYRFFSHRLLTVIGLRAKTPAVYRTVLKTDVVHETDKGRQYFVFLHLIYFHWNTRAQKCHLQLYRGCVRTASSLDLQGFALTGFRWVGCVTTSWTKSSDLIPSGGGGTPEKFGGWGWPAHCPIYDQILFLYDLKQYSSLFKKKNIHSSGLFLTYA